MQENIFAFEIDGRRCELYVYSHCPTHWAASATDDNGSLGKAIHLKKARYRTMEEAAERAIRHFRGYE